MARVGLLTGTFDPVHNAHATIARMVVDSGDCDEVWFLVNPDPAHKLTAVSYADRVEMVRLTIAGRGRMRVWEGFGFAHTLAGFREFMAHFPEHQFVFLVGMDAIARLDRWNDVQSVVDSTSYIVVHRPGTGEQELADLRRRLGPLGSRLKAEVLEVSVPQELSSTAVRLALAHGERPVGIHPAVQRYIEERGLYR